MNIIFPFNKNANILPKMTTNAFLDQIGPFLDQKIDFLREEAKVLVLS